jgi:hypothetical protein
VGDAALPRPALLDLEPTRTNVGHRIPRHQPARLAELILELAG